MSIPLLLQTGIPVGIRYFPQRVALRYVSEVNDEVLYRLFSVKVIIHRVGPNKNTQEDMKIFS